jgi:ribokinase
LNSIRNLEIFMQICVIGSTNVDMTFATPRLPSAGETLSGRSLMVGQGGKGANQAVVAARLGAQVTFISRVGDDQFGNEAIRHFQNEGISTSFVFQDSQQPTGTACILVDDRGENCIVIIAGANGQLTPDDIRMATPAIQDADLVLCQLETPLLSTLEAFRIAQETGVRTMLTPAPAVELPDMLLELCDICIPNRTEIELLTKTSVQNAGDAEAAARLLRARGVKTVVVTLGRDGAFILDDLGGTHIAALAVDAVDTTGAGDAFTASLAVALAEGKSLREASQFAARIAAMSVTRMGTQTSFPGRSDFEKWIANRK